MSWKLTPFRVIASPEFLWLRAFEHAWPGDETSSDKVNFPSPMIS